MRVGVNGGRNYDRWTVIHPVLSRFHTRYGITGIIQGEAKGADFCAATWAFNNRVPLITRDDGTPFKADWDRYGRSAGHRRNEEMVRLGEPDLWISFPGGAGTHGLRKVCVEYCVPCLVIPDREWERMQDPDESAIILDYEGNKPREKPYWLVPPNKRWKVIDPSIRAEQERRAQESAKRYLDVAMF